MSKKLLLEGKRVLLAEDEEFSRKIVVRMLKTLGCTDVTVVGDGQSAEEVLCEPGTFDLVILDFSMPRRNGLDLLKTIRVGLDLVPREQRVMMLTASGDYELLGAAMALDVDAFVTKPVSLRMMAERIRGVFRLWGEYKPASRYDQVDTDEVTQRLIAPLPKPAKTQAERPTAGVLTRLEEVPPGSILAEAVTGPQNQLVLIQGTRLSERLIARLLEVKDVIKVSEIRIEDTEKKEP